MTHCGPFQFRKGMFQSYQEMALTIPALLSHLVQAAGVPGTVSAAGTSALQELPVPSRHASPPSSCTRPDNRLLEL